MARFAILICFFCCFFQLSAQTQWTISGIIRSDIGESLVGVSVFADDYLRAVSDENGQFAFSMEEVPREISVRYLGYFPQKIYLKPGDFRQHAVEVNFRLLNQSPVLKEVTISAKPIETIVKEDFSKDIYDFGFAGSNILLLMREKKRHFLRLVDEQGETLSQLRLPDDCRVLHRSCLGDYHVVGDNWAWEVAFGRGAVDTLTRYPASDFYRLIAPCAQQSAGQYYFLQHGFLNQSLKYIVFEEGKKPSIAYQIEDKKGYKNALGALSDFFSGKPMVFRTPYWAKQPGETEELEIMQAWESAGSPNTVGGLAQLSGYGDDQIYRVAELESIRQDSVYAPLLKINDTLLLFDHVNNRIVHFGPMLAQTEVVEMNYHSAGGFGKLLMQDVISNRIFARFNSRNGLILKEISPYTGQVLKTFELPMAPYISEKFKVKNGSLYFLGQPDVNTPNKMLYKMNIFAGIIR